LYSGIQQYVDWKLLADVSEELNAFINLMFEAIGSSETSFDIYQATRCCIPEDSHLHTGHWEKLKSQTLNKFYVKIMREKGK
jgi:hypothetical protein